MTFFIFDGVPGLDSCLLTSHPIYIIKSIFEKMKMDDEEYTNKYINLRILKSIQEYLSAENGAPSALYPINVPDDLLYQVTRLQGAEKADKLIHHIFGLGLKIWSDNLFNDVFGSNESLEAFVKMVKERNRK